MSAAGILFTTPDRMALFLKRASGAHARTWGLPAGGIEEGEDAEAAARREANEEVQHPADGKMNKLHEADGFTTFHHPVDEHFVPKLNHEHSAYCWAPVNDPPQPMHPGMDTAIKGAFAMDKSLAFDKASMRRMDDNGNLHVDMCHISKANIRPYKGSEIPGSEELGLEPNKVYLMYCDPEELAKAASTFNNLPVLSEHVAVTAFDPSPEVVIGSTGTDCEFNFPYLDNSLVLWVGEEIEKVEADRDNPDAKRELSACYQYQADMTPGSVQGNRYDGVMRGIKGNHVALVKAGRAGSDVVIGDSKHGELLMAKLRTQKGLVAQGALLAFLTPRLAKDQKVDLTDLLGTHITVKKFDKSALLAGIRVACDGKLAKDATLDDVLPLLEKVDGVSKDDAELEPSSALPIKEDDEDAEAGMDADIGTKVCDALKGLGLDEEKIEGIRSMFGKAPVKDAEMDDDDEPAEDADPEKKPVTKGAMDEALKKQGETIRKEAAETQRSIRDAERKVRPWVGELTMAFDSAEGVYKQAFKMLGKDVKGIHASAFPAILESIPQPNARKVLAEDAAIVESAGFHTRFPGADRIKSLG